jgi:hypothetical protein
MRLVISVSVATISALLTACDGDGGGGSGGGGPQGFTATLSGSDEVPPVTTTGTGSVTATLDGTTFSLSGSYSNLSGAATAAHVHTGAVGVNGPILFNLTAAEGVYAGSGTLSGTQSLTSDQINTLNTGGLYVNVHTAANPNGEIRGQLNMQ